ncbi:sigma-70 family RNA polymerase sigma factor [Agromyces bauzanensis]
MPPDDDRRLVALYDAHAPSVWRYVVHLTGDPSGADDIVQETLLRAWRSPRILAQEPESTRSWMFTVARNLVIDEARSARRRHEIGVAETPDRGRDDGTDALFQSLLVEEALAGLDLEHRAVIVHAYYGGCSIAEVARRLGIPEGTVKSRLHYGLRSLRLALQEKGVTR